MGNGETQSERTPNKITGYQNLIGELLAMIIILSVIGSLAFSSFWVGGTLFLLNVLACCRVFYKIRRL